MFLGHFWPFLPHKDFFEKNRLCHTQLYMDPQHEGKFQKKTNETIPRKRTDRRKDGQPLLYKTLLNKAGGSSRKKLVKNLI